MRQLKYVMLMIASLIIIWGAFSFAEGKMKELAEENYLILIGYVEQKDAALADELVGKLYQETVSDTALLQLGADTFARSGYGSEGLSYLREVRGRSSSLRGLFAVVAMVVLFWLFLGLFESGRFQKRIKRAEENCGEAQRAARECDFYKESLQEEKGKTNALIENIAHQIRTPLASLTFVLEILEQETISMDSRKRMEGCYRCIQHIQDLIACLLRTGQLEQEKVHFYFERISVEQLVTEVVSEITNREGKGHVVLKDKEESSHLLALDITWMKEALYNIIGNCIRYSPEDSPVEITCEESEYYACIYIRDRGIGISKEDLPHIFDRFYRSKKNRNQDGFGIGLNMAKLTVEAHHGNLTAESGKEGSCFKLFLPVY